MGFKTRPTLWIPLDTTAWVSGLDSENTVWNFRLNSCQLCPLDSTWCYNMEMLDLTQTWNLRLCSQLRLCGLRLRIHFSLYSLGLNSNSTAWDSRYNLDLNLETLDLTQTWDSTLNTDFLAWDSRFNPDSTVLDCKPNLSLPLVYSELDHQTLWLKALDSIQTLQVRTLDLTLRFETLDSTLRFGTLNSTKTLYLWAMALAQTFSLRSKNKDRVQETHVSIITGDQLPGAK